MLLGPFDSGPSGAIAPISSLTIGIPSYNEGTGIIPTLVSIWDGLMALGLDASPILLSDSSDTMETVEAARSWANRAGAHLSIDHSSHRRSPKEALNVILSSCRSEVLIQVNADVLVPRLSLQALLANLTHPDGCDVAIGAVMPELTSRGLAARAAIFQMCAVYRVVCLLPQDAIRAQGALWGAHRAFYAHFRYSVGAGSLADDVQLCKELSAGSWRVRNASDAVAFTVPPTSLRDFALSTRRYFAADPANSRDVRQLRAAVEQAVIDPLGLACYAAARLYSATVGQHLNALCNTEYWEPVLTTKRRHQGSTQK